jgi:hypothetical protein
MALAVGAVLTHALLALSQAAHLVAGSLGPSARERTRSPRRERAGRTPTRVRLGHES